MRSCHFCLIWQWTLTAWCRRRTCASYTTLLGYRPEWWTSVARDTIIEACQHLSPAIQTSHHQSWLTDADSARTNISTGWRCVAGHNPLTWPPERCLGEVNKDRTDRFALVNGNASDARCQLEHASWSDLLTLSTGVCRACLQFYLISMSQWKILTACSTSQSARLVGDLLRSAEADGLSAPESHWPLSIELAQCFLGLKR